MQRATRKSDANCVLIYWRPARTDCGTALFMDNYTRRDPISLRSAELALASRHDRFAWRTLFPLDDEEPRWALPFNATKRPQISAAESKLHPPRGSLIF